MQHTTMRTNKKDAPILIMAASQQPYLSLGVRFGGVKAFGCEYQYIDMHDAFLRKDYIKHYGKYSKQKDGWNTFVEFVKSEN